MTHLQKELGTSLIHKLILTCGMSPVYFSILGGLSFLFDPKVGILAGLDYLRNATVSHFSKTFLLYCKYRFTVLCLVLFVMQPKQRSTWRLRKKKKCAMISRIPSTAAHFQRGLNLFLLRLFSHTYSSQHKDFYISGQVTCLNWQDMVLPLLLFFSIHWRVLGNP